VTSSKRTLLIPRLSNSVPPSRSLSVNWAVARFALAARGLRKTPAPTYEVPPVLASPVVYHRAPSWYSRSPVDSERIASEIGSQTPSSLGLPGLLSFLRKTPPFAPPANR
jgi:hypothetical protein